MAKTFKDFRQSQVGPLKMQWVLALGIVLMLIILGSIAVLTVKDVVIGAKTEADYLKTHTESETVIAPTIIGTTFNVQSIIAQDVAWSTGDFWDSKSGSQHSFYDSQHGASGNTRIPIITQVTNATYTADVIGHVLDRDMPKLTDRTAVKCWTNTKPQKPDVPHHGKLREVQMSITFEIKYLSTLGDLDESASKSCSLSTTVYYIEYPPDEGSWSGNWKQAYAETYVYAPFNIRPRYNEIQLSVSGEIERIEWTDDILWFQGYSVSKDSDVVPLTIPAQAGTSVPDDAIKQPVIYYYPLKYDLLGQQGVLP